MPYKIPWSETPKSGRGPGPRGSEAGEAREVETVDR